MCLVTLRKEHDLQHSLNFKILLVCLTTETFLVLGGASHRADCKPFRKKTPRLWGWALPLGPGDPSPTPAPPLAWALHVSLWPGHPVANTLTAIGFLSPGETICRFAKDSGDSFREWRNRTQKCRSFVKTNTGAPASANPTESNLLNIWNRV